MVAPVLVDVVHVIGGGEHLRLVDEIHAQGLTSYHVIYGGGEREGGGRVTSADEDRDRAMKTETETEEEQSRFRAGLVTGEGSRA